MKRWLPILAILAAAVGIDATCLGQVPQNVSPFDVGPGDRGATLRQSGVEPSSPPPAASLPPANPLQNLWKNGAVPSPGPLASLDRRPSSPPPAPPLNDDIKVPATAGNWLILVAAYTDKGAPEQARKFVAELRGVYKLNAYTFTKGAAENRKARMEAEAEREKQLEALRQAGLTNVNIPYRLRYFKVEEETAVLVGGYRSRDEAFNDLKARIRKLPCPDPKKVDLQIQFSADEVTDRNGQSKFNIKERKYVNPFHSAFPVPNPEVKHEDSSTDRAVEIKYLREVNAGETLSLFDCKSRYTLAVKQYPTGAMLQENPNDAKAFADRMSRPRVDWAAKNAHNVAEGFRKVGLKDTYVLHARYCSYITMGGFDSPDDPRLKAMKSYLITYFNSDQMRATNSLLDMMPDPVPMEVPH